jgi:hypothetical protein
VGEGRQVAKSPIAAGAGTFTVLATNVKAVAQRLRQQHPNRADVTVIALPADCPGAASTGVGA